MTGAVSLEFVAVYPAGGSIVKVPSGIFTS